jgi:hypothetical protein
MQLPDRRRPLTRPLPRRPNRPHHRVPARSSPRPPTCPRPISEPSAECRWRRCRRSLHPLSWIRTPRPSRNVQHWERPDERRLWSRWGCRGCRWRPRHRPSPDPVLGRPAGVSIPRRWSHPRYRQLPMSRRPPRWQLDQAFPCSSRSLQVRSRSAVRDECHRSSADPSRPGAGQSRGWPPTSPAGGRRWPARRPPHGSPAVLPGRLRPRWAPRAQPGGPGERPPVHARPAPGGRSSSPTSGRSLLEGAPKRAGRTRRAAGAAHEIAAARQLGVLASVTSTVSRPSHSLISSMSPVPIGSASR